MLYFAAISYCLCVACYLDVLQYPCQAHCGAGIQTHSDPNEESRAIYSLVPADTMQNREGQQNLGKASNISKNESFYKVRFLCIIGWRSCLSITNIFKK